ncbi:hypothetical protein [Micromonospora sp. NPDC006431]|uniref:hypothetical protein n=1 Tax=Micromonospora sp. NPDC006431 TaxID=3364235 RepID=UPI0036C4D069
MAEDEVTQTGIRVGGWLPAVSAEPARAPEQALTVPRRLPADGEPASDPAPVRDHLDPSLVRAHAQPVIVIDRPGEGDSEPFRSPAEPAAPPVTGPRPGAVAPAPHSSRSVGGRLAELLGPAAAKVRTAVGIIPDGPVTRVGVARARRRRRRLWFGAAALAALALVLAYVR